MAHPTGLLIGAYPHRREVARKVMPVPFRPRPRPAYREIRNTVSSRPLLELPPFGRSYRGQSLVEFTLVLPILLLLLVTVADFGRYFATGIQIESAARAAAEVAAAEYLGEAAPLDTAAWDRVHAQGWQSVCDEVAGLPNASPPSTPGLQCDGVPTIVCVHDDTDPDAGCGNIYNDAGPVPAQCSSFAPGSLPTSAQAGGSERSRYVEVRVCYRFSAIFRMSIPFFGVNLTPLGGDFYIERDRVFTVADY